MSRRETRRINRHFAILGALAEYGPQDGWELCQLLRRPSGTIYPDLAALEHEGRIVAEWAEVDAFGPRRRVYRLPTSYERAARARAVQTETQETR